MIQSAKSIGEFRVLCDCQPLRMSKNHRITIHKAAYATLGSHLVTGSSAVILGFGMTIFKWTSVKRNTFKTSFSTIKRWVIGKFTIMPTEKQRKRMLLPGPLKKSLWWILDTRDGEWELYQQMKHQRTQISKTNVELMTRTLLSLLIHEPRRTCIWWPFTPSGV